MARGLPYALGIDSVTGAYQVTLQNPIGKDVPMKIAMRIGTVLVLMTAFVQLPSLAHAACKSPFGAPPHLTNDLEGVEDGWRNQNWIDRQNNVRPPTPDLRFFGPGASSPSGTDNDMTTCAHKDPERANPNPHHTAKRQSGAGYSRR